MRWQLYIEEYCPELVYIKGEKNIVADALSRLDIKYEHMKEAYFTEEMHSFLYCLSTEDLSESAFPLSYKVIGAGQSKDKTLLSKIKKNVPG